MSRRILLALQFWEGDKALAMKVARLIADLEPQHSEAADFLFVARNDCKHDQDTIKYVSRKFNVHTTIARRRGTGWPSGCNDLWFSTLDHCYEMTAAKKFPEYKAILTFEADCCPLTPDWIERLHAKWDAAKVNTLGVFCPWPRLHVNGNALFSGDLKFLYQVSRRISGCAPHVGWDVILAPTFEKLGWANCPAMRSIYAAPTLSLETYHLLLKEGVCFLHGIKDGAPINYVRNNFLR